MIAVTIIPNDGVPHMRRVDSYLMRPAGGDRDLHQRGSRTIVFNNAKPAARSLTRVVHLDGVLAIALSVN